ncbi:DEAD/DEAH box helicase [Williamsia deligens]|uniref:DEAD/DEAH box helicase n=1 Tax=Williamsia deligens TaxID=321325 RepID=A0ABW3G8I8_9NOCA|nr:DEAD/DEAH box helicase [Williamsia deligens]MCP2192744.1 Superfamily II DNA or RNA helicase, SNF2 family [Williamsia deligens]
MEMDLSGVRSSVTSMFPEISGPAAHQDWRSRLTPAVDDDTASHRPLTLVLEPVHDETGMCDLALRITVPSEFGLRGRREIDWDEVFAVGGPHDIFATNLEEIDPEHLAAVRALAAVTCTGRARHRSVTASLGRSSPQVWEFLRRAVDAGVTIEPDRSLQVYGVEVVDPVTPGLQLVADADGGVTIHPSVTVPAPHRGTSSAMRFGDRPHGVAVFGTTTLYLAGLLDTDPLVRDLIAGNPVHVPRRDVDEFVSSYLPAIRERVHVRVDQSVQGEVISPPTPALVVHVAVDGTARIEWTVRYLVDERWREFDARYEIDEDPLRDVAAELTLWDSVRDALERTVALATRWWEQAVRHEQQDVWASRTWMERLDPLPRDITQAPTSVLARVYTLSPVEAAVLIGEVVPELRARGDILVEVHGDIGRLRPARRAAVVSFGLGADDVRTDWLDLSIDVDIDGEPVPLPDVLSELARGATHMLLPSGVYFRLDTPELRRLSELLAEARALGEIRDGRVRRDSMNASLWDEVLGIGVVDEQLSEWRGRIANLASAEPPTPVAVPSAVRAELRDYQRRGLDWLTFLWRNGIGGILADDMGLGKTLQTLAFIAHADSPSPFLVVAPTSVVGNWLSEAERFVPDLATVGILGSEKRCGRTVAESVAGARIIVTSYALFRLQFAQLSAISWAGAIFDEAQFVKNSASKTHQCARRLQTPFTLAITGTPMENSLSELWALLSLTVPGLFPAAEVFTRYFRKPIEVGGDPTRLSLLQRRIKPVVLRRTKSEVAADLPPKQEQTVVLALHPDHDRIYRARLNRERQRLLGLLDDFQRNRIAILSSLTMLRQLSLHAGLVDDDHAGVASAKVDHLARVVPELVEAGHSSLVFSQFTGFLRIVRDRLEAEGLSVRYIDGSMSAHARASEVEQFRVGGPSVFLISLKAGGFGMNLTEADHCFVCDPWWNPAAEAQAVDRAHRIGQTRPVSVYRLVSADTIEEKVVALQERKRALFDAVVGDADVFGSAIDAGDIAGMLGG